jgi:hypothetical protein
MDKSDNIILYGRDCFSSYEEYLKFYKLSDLSITLKSGASFPLHHYLMAKYTNIFYDNLNEAQRIISKYDDEIVNKLFIYCYTNKLEQKNNNPIDFIIDLIQIQCLALELGMNNVAKSTKKYDKKIVNYQLCFHAMEKIFKMIICEENYVELFERNKIPIISEYFANPSISDFLFFTSKHMPYYDYLFSKIKKLEFSRTDIQHGSLYDIHRVTIINVNIDSNIEGIVLHSIEYSPSNYQFGLNTHYTQYNVIVTSNVMFNLVKHYQNKHFCLVSSKKENELENIIYLITTMLNNEKKNISNYRLLNVCDKNRSLFQYFLIINFDYLNDIVVSLTKNLGLSRDKIIQLIEENRLKLSR